MDMRTKEAVRYLGYGKCAVDDKTLQLIQESFEELEQIARKKFIYRIFELSTIDENTFTIGNIMIRSKNLGTILKDCEEVILFATTLGIEVDRQIRKYELLGMSKAVVMQACATVVLEEFCDEMQEKLAGQLKRDEKFLRPRFSPGYGDFSILNQKDLLAMLEAAKQIGLTMTEGYMLTPTKSVTAVIGISDKQVQCRMRGCETCTKEDCVYRRS